MLKGAGLDCVVQETAQRDSIASGLSRREREVLAGLCSGRSEKQVALALGLSAHTVRSYISAIYREFNVCSRAELLSLWIPRAID